MRRLLLPCCALLAACPPSGRVLSFTATPPTITTGGSATLAWKSEGAPGCTLAPGVGEVPANGEVTVSPAQSTRYELTCGAGGSARTVTVREAVVISSFTATPSDTLPDGVVRLAWSAQASKVCYLDPGDEEVPATGTRQVQVASDTTFVFTCEGEGGPVEAQAPVTVTPVTSLDAPTNLTFAVGDGALTLTWDQPLNASNNVYFAEEAGLDAANTEAKVGGVVYRKVVSPFTVSGLVNGRTSYARVSAVSGTVESGLSAERSGTPVAGAAVPDTFAAAEWHLANTGQEGGTAGEDTRATLAWTQTRGEGVRVAVVDEGVDLLHPDLSANAATLMSHDYLGNTPRRFAEHGTCVGGLVAARDGNGRGVRGVAPRANLVSYNVLQDLTSANEYDAMTRGLDRNAVSNNSWGDAEDGTGLLTPPDPLWLLGVERGATLGRGGKGTVYLWAAGNGGDTADNANYDGQANARFVLAIGGVGDDGQKASYSEEGANLLVVTPTEGRAGHALTTTDLPGAWGYNDGNVPGELSDPDYTRTMNGTSASTPVAAGVAALVLAANPELTWRDVRRVLAHSARKNDPLDADWVLNGAGLHVNHKYGFGVVDAQAAVALAKAFTAGAPEVAFEPPPLTPNAAVPDDGTPVSSFVDVSGSGIAQLDSVQVTVTLPHPRSGDLELRLEKQGGAFDLLHVRHDCAVDQVTGQRVCSALDGYRFGTVRHLDEPADGRWTLSVRDLATGETGTLASWTLSLYGRP